MIWAQAGISFVLWIAYGVLLARKTAHWKSRLSRLCQVRRKVYGPTLMIVGAALMFIGLLVVATYGGLTPEGLALWAWLTITLSGLIFVHTQSLATMMIISLVDPSVTQEGTCAFDHTGTPEKKDVQNPNLS